MDPLTSPLMESFRDDEQIFDLDAELAPLENEAQADMLEQLDIMAQKIAAVLRARGELDEASTHQVLELIPIACTCARAGMTLGLILMMLHEFPAMRDLHRQLREKHGELAPFLFFQAVAEEKLGNRNTALELLRKIVSLGTKNYWVYLRAAQLQHRLGQFEESMAMANLAVYENRHEHVEPFVLLAQNFHAVRQISRMLECFGRVEKLKGEQGLASIGPLYQAYRQMYQNLKKFAAETS